MRRELLSLVCAIATGVCARNACAHWRSVHERMAETATNKVKSNWPGYPSDCDNPLKQGHWQEDGRDGSVDKDLTQHHGYNPITGTTGGGFKLLGVIYGTSQTAKARAASLWSDMRNAAQRGNLAGEPGDGWGGAYNYLGRCGHLLQDMTSLPHVVPNVNPDYESTPWWPRFADPGRSLIDAMADGVLAWRTDSWGYHSTWEKKGASVPDLSAVLHPGDALPADAFDKLDTF